MISWSRDPEVEAPLASDLWRSGVVDQPDGAGVLKPAVEILTGTVFLGPDRPLLIFTPAGLQGFGGGGGGGEGTGC